MGILVPPPLSPGEELHPEEREVRPTHGYLWEEKGRGFGEKLSVRHSGRLQHDSLEF